MCPAGAVRWSSGRQEKRVTLELRVGSVWAAVSCLRKESPQAWDAVPGLETLCGMRHSRIGAGVGWAGGRHWAAER